VAQDAVRVLPELLAKKLSALLPDDDELQIAAPVRIRLSLKMSELSDAAASVSSPDPAQSGTPFSSTLDDRIETALRAALGLVQSPPPGRQASRPEHSIVDNLDVASFDDRSSEASALDRLLLAWHEQGVLERRLAVLSSQQLEIWHRRLRRNKETATVAEIDAAMMQRIEALVLAYPPWPPSHDVVKHLRRQIVIVLAVAAKLGLPPGSGELWRVLDDLASLDPVVSSQQDTTAPSATVDPAQERELLEPSSVLQTAQFASSQAAPPGLVLNRPSGDWELRIECALPFLLLGPLARLGYLDTLTAVLDAANLDQHAASFATALAYKVLDPPQRGWRRTPAATEAAAAMAGLRKPVADESLVDFARIMASHTAALDITLADALVDGHTAGEPVTLDSDGSGGFLLIDTQGCFPIAFAAECETLVALLKRLGSPLVLVSEATARTRVLSELNAAGMIFVVDVPPARGESWRRLRRGPAQLGWTNFAGEPAEPLYRAASASQLAWQEARSLTADLGTTRPGVIRANSPALDRSVTLAASVALGLIAWKLWQSREPTSPQLLLERYGDFEGRIRFDSASVKVCLPLGRRHRELNENGFLAPISGVPWLGRRRIEFGGG
jgi:hypothetical protein